MSRSHVLVSSSCRTKLGYPTRRPSEEPPSLAHRDKSEGSLTLVAVVEDRKRKVVVEVVAVVGVVVVLAEVVAAVVSCVDNEVTGVGKCYRCEEEGKGLSSKKECS